jgi:hypothetical protein
MGIKGGLFPTQVPIFRFVRGILYQLSFLVRNLIHGVSRKKNGSRILSLFVMSSSTYLEFKFLIINQLDALISQIYSWIETLHVSDSSSVHHQEFFTVHTAMV